jgi:hypothetical protein
MHQLAPMVSEAYKPLSAATGTHYRDFFCTNKYVVLPNFFSDWGFSLLREESQRLATQTVRRDIFIDETLSWRHMATLGSLKLRQFSSIIPNMYQCGDLFDFLTGVAGESVDGVPDKNEQYVLNCLLQDGDFHGSHVDSYSFAFNIIIDTPPPGSGGVVKIIEPQDSDPHDAVATEIPLHPNDAYFMRTDIAIHMVTSIADHCRRVALNFAYKGLRDEAEESYSSSLLYS